MKLRDIFLEFLREELLLFRDTERYRSIIATRLVALSILTILGVGIWQVAVGKVQFDMGFVLSIFSIFISWLFFWSADRSSDRQSLELKGFITEFRNATERRFDSLEKKNELTSITNDESKPLPQVSSTNPQSEFEKLISASLKVEAKQLLIALGKLGRGFNEYSKIDYGYESKHTQTRGFTTLSSLRRQLAQLGLIDFDATSDEVSLSQTGKKVVKWLEDNDQKALFFESPQLGGWGSPSETYLKIKSEAQKHSG